MRIELIFPPFWSCSAPYLSIPSLAAYLYERGYNVVQKDFNLECYDTLLSKNFLFGCAEKISQRSDFEQDDVQQIYFLLEYVAKHVADVKNTFRNKQSLDMTVYERCSCFFDL